MITFCNSENLSDLNQILKLQSANLEEKVSPEELKSQGFVTVKHTLALLDKMNLPYKHIIGKNADEVIGYSLVMLKSFSTDIPVLVPMFDVIDGLIYDGIKLETANYFVMGQICVAKDYRGKGVFQGLYEKLRQQMHEDFDFVITEVATRNTRSIQAHSKVGFKSIKQYVSEAGEEWDILLWDWS